MYKYIKNKIRDITPQSIKMLNDNFDYIYDHLNKTTINEVSVSNISNIDLTSADNFTITLANGRSSSVSFSRDSNGYLSSSGAIQII